MGQNELDKKDQELEEFGQIVLEEGSLIKVYVQTGIQVCDRSARSLWKQHYCAYIFKSFFV